MIRRPARSTRVRCRQRQMCIRDSWKTWDPLSGGHSTVYVFNWKQNLSLIHISEPTRLLSTSYAVFCLKKKNKNKFHKKFNHFNSPPYLLIAFVHKETGSSWEP